MSTLKQKNANRANARKSTGPITPEGKSIVSLNAVKHGLRSSVTVLPGEDQEEFDRRLNTAYENWNPINNYEDSLCLCLVRNDWYMARAARALADLLTADLKPVERSTMTDRIYRQMARFENQHLRAGKQLDRLNKERNKLEAQQNENNAKKKKQDAEDEWPKVVPGMAWQKPDGTYYMVSPPSLRYPHNVFVKMPKDHPRYPHIPADKAEDAWDYTGPGTGTVAFPEQREERERRDRLEAERQAEWDRQARLDVQKERERQAEQARKNKLDPQADMPK